MNEDKYAEILFKHIDNELNNAARKIRNKIFSHFRDIPWTPEQYRSLQPILREELNYIIQHLLDSLENKGSILPEGVLGFEIRAHDYDEIGNFIDIPIREGAFPDYGDMWWEYLHKK
jgi:hypothetical protein